MTLDPSRLHNFSKNFAYDIHKFNLWCQAFRIASRFGPGSDLQVVKPGHKGREIQLR
jgi:hypothetical protein